MILPLTDHFSLFVQVNGSSVKGAAFIRRGNAADIFAEMGGRREVESLVNVATSLTSL